MDHSAKTASCDITHAINRLTLYVQCEEYSPEARTGIRWRFDAVGSDVGQINEVTLRRVRLVLGWVTCRLDWCNSLLCGVPENLLRKVQSVQNAAARLLTSARRCDHITPLLRQLHWLPVQRRAEFKIACLVHQFLASLALTYLTCLLYTSPSPRD